MTNITALVRSAIGFNEKRGDQVQVTNMRFAETEVTPGDEGTSEPLLGIESAIWFKLGQILILSVTALLVFLLVVKPMIRRLTTPPGAHAEGARRDCPPGAARQHPRLRRRPPASPGASRPDRRGTLAQTALPKRESMIDISQIEGQVRESAIRKIGDVVQAHPEEAMAIVRTWLHQPA